MSFRLPSGDDFKIQTPDFVRNKGNPYSGLNDFVYQPQGLRGLGLYSNADLPAKSAVLKQIDGQIATIASSIQASMTQYGSALEASPDASLIAKAQDAMASFSAISSDLQSIAQRSGPFGSFGESDAAGKAMDEIEQRARGIITTYSSLPSTIQNAGRRALDAVRAAQAAQVAAGQAAQAQQVRDVASVNSAVSRANTAAAAGDYAGALGILQNQGIVDAATRIGRADDLAGAAQQVAYSKAAADRQSASVATADTQRQAQAARVDAALAQAQGLTASGNYGGALAALASVAGLANQLGRGDEVSYLQSQVQQAQLEGKEAQRVAQVSNRVDAAIQSANAYAGSGSYDVALSVLNAAMGDAAQVGRSGELAAAQAAIDGARRSAATAATQPAPGTRAPLDPAQLELIRSCMQQQGQWNPEGGFCDLSAVFTRRQAQEDADRALRLEDRQSDRLLQILPLVMGDPQLLAQVLRALIPGAGMAANVPGGSGGDLVRTSGQYSSTFGEERF